MIDGLSHKYTISKLLKLAGIPRSTYYYYVSQTQKEDKYKHKCHKIRGLRPMTIGVRMYKLSTVSQYDISMKFLGEKNNDNGNNLHLNKNACNENIKTSENEENPARFYTIDVRLFDGDAISFLGVVDMIETSVCRKMREQM